MNNSVRQKCMWVLKQYRQWYRFFCFVYSVSLSFSSKFFLPSAGWHLTLLVCVLSSHHSYSKRAPLSQSLQQEFWDFLWLVCKHIPELIDLIKSALQVLQRSWILSDEKELTDGRGKTRHPSRGMCKGPVAGGDAAGRKGGGLVGWEQTKRGVELFQLGLER